jgi:uncharacterized damage-inducible protein DinB
VRGIARNADRRGTGVPFGRMSVPDLDRVNPPWIADERTMLEAWLNFHRATLLRKCRGLTAEQLSVRSVAPSSLSLLGLVRHMSDVERSWFRRGMAGDDIEPIFYTDERPDDDFDDLGSSDPDEVFAIFGAEVDAARKITARYDSLDAIATRKRHDHDVSLRWIMVHMIEEYARHNGHADLLREAIDGATGD